MTRLLLRKQLRLLQLRSSAVAVSMFHNSMLLLAPRPHSVEASTCRPQASS